MFLVKTTVICDGCKSRAPSVMGSNEIRASCAAVKAGWKVLADFYGNEVHYCRNCTPTAEVVMWFSREAGE